MSSNIQVMVVQTGVGRNRATEKVHFKREGGCWKVKGWDDGMWREFADNTARPKDVRQLIKKEYDVRY